MFAHPYDMTVKCRYAFGKITHILNSERKMNMNDKNELLVVGKNIKLLRQTRKMTRATLVRKSKYDRQDMKNLEEGEQDIRLNTLVKIAKVLDVEVPLLLSRRFRVEIDSPFKDVDYMMIFTSNVYRIIRNSSSKTEADMAEQTGIDPTTLSRILNQGIESPRLSTLFMIAEYLEVTLESLFSRRGGESI